MNRRRTLTYFHSAFEVSVRAPQTRMPRPGKRRIALTPVGIELVLLVVVDVVFEVERAAQDLVRRRLEHAALGVGAGVDAEHVPAGRHELARAGLRVGDVDPRVVERGVLRVGDRLRAARSPWICHVPFGQSTTAKRKRSRSQCAMTFLIDVDRDGTGRVDQRHVAIRIELQRGETLRLGARRNVPCLRSRRRPASRRTVDAVGGKLA